MNKNLYKLIKLNLIHIRKIKNSKTKSIFCISFSRKLNSNSYLTPIRLNKNYIIFGIVLCDKKIFYDIKSLIVKNFDYIAFDLETFKKKVLEVNDVLKIVNKDRLLFYKGNDLTVESVWIDIITNYSPKNKILIYGMGNIGTKLMIKLIESGYIVHGYRRDKMKNSLTMRFLDLFTNKIEKKLYSKVSLKRNLNQYDLIITATNIKNSFDKNLINNLKKNINIYDVGIDNFDKLSLKLLRNKNIHIRRADVSNELLKYFDYYIQYLLKNNYGTKKINNYQLVSGGFFGRLGDIVVDDYKKPSFVYGISNGSGNFMNIKANTLKKIKKIVLKK